ncbi:formamidopyrimidine-DNA glycosylase [candidate division KSB1 bacterium]|nr:formamidopyrimidine-DNA glycosylase [candidate division KSB1 bacterium]
MPEYPDIVVYIERMGALLKGRILERIRISSPFLLRSVSPPIDACFGKTVLGFERIGKRIVWELSDNHFIILHLMVSGRLHWRSAKSGIPGKVGLAAFDFGHGSMLLTEAAQKKRASLYLTVGRESIIQFDPGGIDVLSISLDTFRNQLQQENHTLKRSLTDPRIFSGIGSSYSDEILHRARLSPVQLTSNLTDEQITMLYEAIQTTLLEWTNHLRTQTGDNFPEKVTAFQPEMAVHGRYGKPCPVCHSKVQRIRYVANETNYCPTCQTDGKLLADRALSRLLKSDWPKTPEELDERLNR